MVHGPYRGDPDAGLVTLERALRRLPGLDLDAQRAEVGRLILGPAGLYWVSGWEVHRQRTSAGVLDVGLLLAVLPDAFADAGTAPEGQRMLEELRGLPPDEQVERAAGSLHLAAHDIGAATLGRLFGPLRVVTAAQGEVLEFELARAARGDVRRWVDSLHARRG